MIHACPRSDMILSQELTIRCKCMNSFLNYQKKSKVFSIFFHKIDKKTDTTIRKMRTHFIPSTSSLEHHIGLLSIAVLHIQHFPAAYDVEAFGQ